MLRLRLLGTPSICDDAGEIRLPSQKAQALLFYLAAEAQRGFARGQLITLLWEDSSEREGRNSLSTVLTRLRQALPAVPVRAEGDTLVHVRRSSYPVVDEGRRTKDECASRRHPTLTGYRFPRVCTIAILCQSRIWNAQAMLAQAWLAHSIFTNDLGLL